MKGIVLAGGTGTRLFPITMGLSKQLLPVYNKPMIYYAISTLMLAGIKEILVITNPEFINLYKNFLGDGSHLGVSIDYVPQEAPRGIAEAFILGQDFIENDSVCLILGDNIFHGHNLPELLLRGRRAVETQKVSVIFGYNVSNPSDYGVVDFNDKGEVLHLEEKPKQPRSNCAIVGLYMYDNSVIEVAKKIKPSKRGELEITAINQVYLEKKELHLEIFGRGYAWFDAGNCDSLFKAAAFVQNIEKRQGLKIACLEEIAYYMGFITRNQLKENAAKLSNSEYGEYLLNLDPRGIYPDVPE